MIRANYLLVNSLVDGYDADLYCLFPFIINMNAELREMLKASFARTGRLKTT